MPALFLVSFALNTGVGAGTFTDRRFLLQGIRRIVAVTGQEAAEAIKAGEALADQLAAAQKLQGQDLEKEVAALKQVSCLLRHQTTSVVLAIISVLTKLTHRSCLRSAVSQCTGTHSASSHQWAVSPADS